MVEGVWELLTRAPFLSPLSSWGLCCPVPRAPSSGARAGARAGSARRPAGGRACARAAGACVRRLLHHRVDFPQSFGGRNLKRVGVILQRGVLILLLCCLPCWAIFINTESLLRLLKQDPEVSRSAASPASEAPGRRQRPSAFLPWLHVPGQSVALEPSGRWKLCLWPLGPWLGRVVAPAARPGVSPFGRRSVSFS